jgi:hypothetical protein
MLFALVVTFWAMSVELEYPLPRLRIEFRRPNRPGTPRAGHPPEPARRPPANPSRNWGLESVNKSVKALIS